MMTCLSRSGLGFFWKNTSGGFYDGERWREQASPFAIKGTSDILGILHGGRFVALEVKDKARATSEQLAFIEKVRALGGIGAVVKTVDQVRQVLLDEGLDVREFDRAHAILKSHI